MINLYPDDHVRSHQAELRRDAHEYRFRRSSRRREPSDRGSPRPAPVS
jgi:hypothetical protein